MRTSIRWGFVALALVLLVPGPAQANLGDTGNVKIIGTGTIAPGLDLNTGPKNVTFSGNFIFFNGVISTVHAGEFDTRPLGPYTTCAFTGGSLAENLFVGVGAVNGTCRVADLAAHPVRVTNAGPPGPGAIDAQVCNLAYTRVGNQIVVVGGCNLSFEQPVGTVVAACVAEVRGAFVMTPTTNPVGTFLLTGEADYVCSN